MEVFLEDLSIKDEYYAFMYMYMYVYICICMCILINSITWSMSCEVILLENRFLYMTYPCNQYIRCESNYSQL